MCESKKLRVNKVVCFLKKYQPSGAGGTRSPPATPHLPLNPKVPAGS